MLTTLYFVYALVIVGLIVATLRLQPGRGRTYVWLLLAVLVGLAYDNLIIALGAFIGEGDLLKTLNAGRFAGHALGTPLLAIFAFGVLRHAGLGWAQGKTWHVLVCLFTTALVGLGIYKDMISLELAPRVLADTFRYTNVAAKGPPIPSILTIIALVVMGIFLWRKTGWQWLALGALVMFTAAAVGTGDRTFIANFGEAALGIGCVLTAQKYFFPNPKARSQT